MPVNGSIAQDITGFYPQNPLTWELFSYPVDLHPLGCAAPIYSLILPAIIEHLLYTLGGAHHGGWGGRRRAIFLTDRGRKNLVKGGVLEEIQHSLSE